MGKQAKLKQLVAEVEVDLPKMLTDSHQHPLTKLQTNLNYAFSAIKILPAAKYLLHLGERDLFYVEAAAHLDMGKFIYPVRRSRY